MKRGSIVDTPMMPSVQYLPNLGKRSSVVGQSMINFSNQQTPLKEWGDYSPEMRDLKEFDIKEFKTIANESTKYVGKNSYRAK